MIYQSFAFMFRKLFMTQKWRTLCFAVVGLCSILFLSAIGFMFLEEKQHLSLFDSLWLSYVTMTTVGYGDIYPQSLPGRLLGMVLTMTGGIGLVAYLATFIATTFLERQSNKMKGLARIDVRNHILLVNCPNEDKILTVIAEIRKDSKSESRPIVLIDPLMDERPESFTHYDKFHFVKGNPLLLRVLERANASAAHSAIILARDPADPNSDGVTTQLAITLKHIHDASGSNIHMVAEAVTSDSIAPLKASGVQEVICLENIIAPLLVQAMLDPGVTDVAEDLWSNMGGHQYYLGDITHLEGRRYGSIAEFFHRRRHLDIVPIGLHGSGGVSINPTGETVVSKDDRLIYISAQRKNLKSIGDIL